MFKRLFGKSRAKTPAPFTIPVDLQKIGGNPELDYLFIEPSEIDIGRALDAWQWIGLEGLTVISVSAFGDAFLRAGDGSISFLDTLEGRLTRIASGLPELAAKLQEANHRDGLLMAGFVIGARQHGLILGAGECYDFDVAPVLGGKVSFETMHKMSFVVKVHLAGQIHEQVKNLPEGTRISGFKITD